MKKLFLLPAIALLCLAGCTSGKKKSIAPIDTNAAATINSLIEKANTIGLDSFNAALTMLNSATDIAKPYKNDSLIASIDFNIVRLCRGHGKEDTAAAITDKWLKKLSYENYRQLYVKYKFEKQDMFFGPGYYKDGIAYALDFIKEAEKYKDTATIIYCTSDIGSGLNDMRQNEESLYWLKKADQVSTHKKYDTVKVACALYINMAQDYIALKSYDSAITVAKKCMQLAKEFDMVGMYAISGQTLAWALSCKKNPQALPLFEEMDSILVKNARLYFKLFGDAKKTKAYANLGQPEKGIVLARKTISTLKQSPIVPLDIVYESLAECYKADGNLPAYSATIDTLLKLRNDMYAENSEKEIANYRVKYEVSVKERQIAEQRLKLEKRNEIIYLIIAAVAVIAFAAFLIIRSRLQRNRLKQQLVLAEEKRKAQLAIIEAETKERNRIAFDLHDNLGAYANAVLYGTEQLQAENSQEQQQTLINNLQFASKEVILSLRETIWALKKDFYTDQECLARVQNFTYTMKNNYPQIKFTINTFELTGRRLINTDALNLIRIIQEAMTNSIKHAQPTEIFTNVSETEKHWLVNVCDNGKGFETDTAYDYLSHSGLKSMKQRAAESGMDLTIKSELRKGTCIEIAVLKSKLHNPL